MPGWGLTNKRSDWWGQIFAQVLHINGKERYVFWLNWKCSLELMWSIEVISVTCWAQGLWPEQPRSRCGWWWGVKTVVCCPPHYPVPTSPGGGRGVSFSLVVSEISASGVRRRKPFLALLLVGSRWEARLDGKPEFQILVTFQAYVWVTSQEICHWLDIKNEFPGFYLVPPPFFFFAYILL